MIGVIFYEDADMVVKFESVTSLQYRTELILPILRTLVIQDESVQQLILYYEEQQKAIEEYNGSKNTKTEEPSLTNGNQNQSDC